MLELDVLHALERKLKSNPVIDGARRAEFEYRIRELEGS
jgi:hypothetical protein